MPKDPEKEPAVKLKFEGNWFEGPIEVVIKSREDFEVANGTNDRLPKDWMTASFSGTPEYRVARESLIANTWVHSGHYIYYDKTKKPVPFPGQKMFEDPLNKGLLIPGMVLTITSPESKTPGPVHLAYLGASESIEANRYNEEWGQQVVDWYATRAADVLTEVHGPDNPLTQAVYEKDPKTDDTRNIVGFTWCDPETRRAGVTENRQIALFVVWHDDQDIDLSPYSPTHENQPLA